MSEIITQQTGADSQLAKSPEVDANKLDQLVKLYNAENGVARLMDTNQAAEYLAISKRSLQEKMAKREIAYVKIGKSVRFHPDDLKVFIDRHRITTEIN